MTGARCCCGTDCNDALPLCVEVALQGIRYTGLTESWSIPSGTPSIDCFHTGPITLLAGLDQAVLLENVSPWVGIRAGVVLMGTSTEYAVEPDEACGEFEPHTFIATGSLSVQAELFCQEDGTMGIQSVFVSVFFEAANASCFGDLCTAYPVTFTVFEWATAGPLAQMGDTLPNQLTGSIFGGTATFRIPPSCIEPPAQRLVAVLCDDEETRIAVDPTTNTAPEAGIEFEEELYRLTEETTEDAAVTVAWVEEVCPPRRLAINCENPADTVAYAPGDAPAGSLRLRVGTETYALGGPETDLEAITPDEWLTTVCPDGKFLAYRCRDTGFALLAPEVIPYEPAIGIGVGEGRVKYLLTSSDCTLRVWYQPTDEPSGIPTPPGTIDHQSGGCGDDLDFRVCRSSVDEATPIEEVCDICDTLGEDTPPDIQAICDIVCAALLISAPPGSPEPAARRPAPIVRAVKAATVKARQAVTYAVSEASGRHAPPEVVRERERSCFGDPAAGLAPCPALKVDQTGSWCGACGCGSRAKARLDEDEQGRSKLQFTVLTCPKKRKGFTNEDLSP